MNDVLKTLFNTTGLGMLMNAGKNGQLPLGIALQSMMGLNQPERERRPERSFRPRRREGSLMNGLQGMQQGGMPPQQMPQAPNPYQRSMF